jgi:olefin beta-lactone synthetase
MICADIVNISRPLTEMARLQPDMPAIIFPRSDDA